MLMIQDTFRDIGIEATKELLNWLKQVSVQASEAKSFVISEAPDYARQVIEKELYSRAYLISCGVFFVVIFFIVSRVLLSKNRAALKADPKYDNSYLAGSFFCIAPMIAGVILIIVNLYGFVQVYFAPKVYLVDQILSMLRR